MNIHYDYPSNCKSIDQHTLNALWEPSNWARTAMLMTDMEASRRAMKKAPLSNLNNCIKKVYFNDPVTVVIWEDGSKTIVRCSENDYYDAEKGLAMAIIKRFMGNDNSFHKVFKKWVPEEENDISLGDFMANILAYMAMHEKEDK